MRPLGRLWPFSLSILIVMPALAVDNQTESEKTVQEEVLWPDPQPKKKEELLISEKVLNAHEDVAAIPITYNFDQKVGQAHQGTTNYINAQPYVPFRLSENYSFVLYPSFTYQYFNNFDGINSQAFKPIVLQTFFTQSGQTTLRTSFGVGPMMVIPTGAGLEFGTQQTGVGYTFGGFHRTERWVVGLLGYQSFGVSPPQKLPPSANYVSVHPTIKYITAKAGSITLNSEATFHTDGQGNSVPINLMGSKIVSFGNQPLLLTLGVRYWAVSTGYGGAQGWGGRIGVMYSFAD
jgi:hypothetical protein